MTELKNRGVSDVLLLCCDGLKGLPEAAKAVWTLVDVQLCVVHLVRNSLRYASKADWGPITRQLKTIYTAPSLNAAESAFEEFAESWEEKYPAIVKSWRVSRVPRRAPQGRVFHERHRVAERQVAQSRCPQGALPNRSGSAQSAVPRVDRTPEEPVEPYGLDQRLEVNPEHPDHPLR
jgi:hypothetical protein